jgi:6-phosphogluconolactonase
MLAERVVAVANEAVVSRGRFVVAFAGGSLPKQLCPGLIALSESIDFSKWHVFFGDERFVSRDHEESTWKVFNEMLFSKVPIPSEQIYTLHDLPEGSTLDAAGEWYEQCLLKYSDEGAATPRLDLVFCGMGPDGHTCSLFPGHPLLEVQDKLVATITDSPKPPPERVTITFPVIQAARMVMFVAVGAGKADMLPLILGNHQSRSIAQHENHVSVRMSVGNARDGITPADMSLPCAKVCNLSPAPASVLWIVDNAAASRLLDESKL